MRISDWSSDVCSSDLPNTQRVITQGRVIGIENECRAIIRMPDQVGMVHKRVRFPAIAPLVHEMHDKRMTTSATYIRQESVRSEEHTSELQSLMRISYAVFCLKKKKKTNTTTCRHEAPRATQILTHT